MELLRWLSPLVFSLAFGLLYVQFLTVHPLKMSRYLLAATLAFVAAVVSLAVGFQGWELLLAILLAFASALGGYVLMTRRVLSREDPRRLLNNPQFGGICTLTTES